MSREIGSANPNLRFVSPVMKRQCMKRAQVPVIDIAINHCLWFDSQTFVEATIWSTLSLLSRECCVEFGCEREQAAPTTTGFGDRSR